MKLFTRCAFLLAVLALPLASALAATITVQVGDNFYRVAGTTSSTIRMFTNDVLVFQYVGALSHPTASDTNLFPLFQMNTANPSKTFPAGTFPAGSSLFHCTAHGAPGGIGQFGTLMVTAATASATLDANAAGIAVSVFPNPSRGQVTVQLNHKTGQDYKLRLSNIIGQEVRTVALKPELTGAGQPVDLSDLRTGVYFYSLLVDGKVLATKRLVLQN